MTDASASERERALVEAARGGDAAALEALMQAHMGTLHRFALRMCRDPEDAKDVVQDTLFSLARTIRDFRGDAQLSTWLYTVARRHCLKKHRKHAPPTETLDAAVPLHEGAATELASPDKQPDAALESRRLEQALEDAIGELEPKYRDVLVLRDAEGLTAPEVAEVLGVSADAVKSRLHRARVAVRARMAGALGLEPEGAPPSGCPDILTMFSRHLEHEISADLCADMERHLAGCARCRGACDSLRRTLSLCKTAPTSQVPAALQDSVRIAVKDFLGLGP